MHNVQQCNQTYKQIQRKGAVHSGQHDPPYTGYGTIRHLHACQEDPTELCCVHLVHVGFGIERWRTSDT